MGRTIQDGMMIDDISDIADFYSTDPQRENVRLERHQLEHELTWRYLAQHLPASGSVLEVGAATGKYSLELARRGYSVTALDLSAALLEEAEKQIAEEGLETRVRFLIGDARDLSEVAEKDFDAVLMMGPLYHLVEEEDRRAALGQAFHLLRSGGLIVSSFLSRFGILGDLMKNIPDWIEDQECARSLLERGRRPDDSPRGGFRGYFARVSEIIPLHEGVGFETIALVGVEPAISADDESFNTLQGKRRALWLDLLHEISQEPTILGASRHLLYIGRRMA